jgi:hypothetical protein
LGGLGIERLGFFLHQFLELFFERRRRHFNGFFLEIFRWSFQRIFRGFSTVFWLEFLRGFSRVSSIDLFARMARVDFEIWDP